MTLIRRFRLCLVQRLWRASFVKAMLHEAIFRAICNAQRCKKKFTCNTPFCNCNCCVANCKKSRTTLYFSQGCETSCLHVTSPQQLATQFFSEWANQSSSLASSLSASAISFVIVRVASCEKSCKRVTPPLTHGAEWPDIINIHTTLSTH